MEAPQIRFIDNTVPAGIDHKIAQLGSELESTLVIVVSKSGGTPETRNGLLEVQKAFREAVLEFSKQGVAITQENSLLDLDGNRVNQGITVYGNKGSTDQHAYVCLQLKM